MVWHLPSHRHGHGPAVSARNADRNKHSYPPSTKISKLHRQQLLSAINTITLTNMAEHSTPAGARMPAPSSSGTAGSMPAGPGATGGSLASSSSFLHPASASTVRPVRAAAAGAYRLHIADPLTLAFDDVDGSSGIRNQVDPDVLAELLHFHDSVPD